MQYRNTDRLWEERAPFVGLAGYQAPVKCPPSVNAAQTWVCPRVRPGRSNQRLVRHWGLKLILWALILGFQLHFWCQFSAELEDCLSK